MKPFILNGSGYIITTVAQKLTNLACSMIMIYMQPCAFRVTAFLAATVAFIILIYEHLTIGTGLQPVAVFYVALRDYPTFQPMPPITGLPRLLIVL